MNLKFIHRQAKPTIDENLVWRIRNLIKMKGEHHHVGEVARKLKANLGDDVTTKLSFYKDGETLRLSISAKTYDSNNPDSIPEQSQQSCSFVCFEKEGLALAQVRALRKVAQVEIHKDWSLPSLLACPI